ncbi:MAG: hypothetical protein Q9218_000620 [Villophora microphyllina]
MESSDLQKAPESHEYPKPPTRARRHNVTKIRKEYHTLSLPELIRREILPNEYSHTPLNPEEDVIRLLRLERGDPDKPIICSFIVVSLAKGAERPPYEALSYYWGTDEPSNEIGIRRELDKRSLKSVANVFIPQRFNIRKSLYEALKHFRTVKDDVILWIDALCIDQENETEKNQQVAQMARIYSSAAHVLVWLGAGRSDCERAMDFVGEVIQLSKLDALVKDESSPPKWNDFNNLLHCRWFSRRWIVQELACAQEATLHYAKKSVYWTDFADAVALFVDKVDEIKPLFRTFREFNYDTEHLGDVMALGASILVDVTRNSFRKQKSDTEDRYIESLSSLEALMSNLLSFKATDPRDTIYALLSIIRDNADRSINPDYNKSAIEVYRDFTKFCVEKSNSVDIICRHWAPVVEKKRSLDRLKKTRKPKDELLAKIPSWVPVLTGSPIGDPQYVPDRRSNGDSLVGHPDRKRYNASKNTPALVDFKDHRIGEPSVEPNQTSHINHVFYMYVEGFKVDTITKVSSRIADGLLLRECLTMGGWEEESDDQSPDDVPDKLWRTLVADRGPDGNNPPTWYQRACSESFAASTTSGDINTGALIANPRSPSHVVQFLKRVQSIVWNRVFVTTHAKNHFGLAPQATRPGDFLCILLGCTVPVILRESKSEKGQLEHYELIGETYIYGLMDGEALDGEALDGDIEDSYPYEKFKLG